MKKLKLEELSVVSFETAPRGEERGTVRAHADPTTIPCLFEEHTPACEVTGGINSCWCTEYNTCRCA